MEAAGSWMEAAEAASAMESSEATSMKLKGRGGGT
jgi:hypothetical protein